MERAIIAYLIKEGVKSHGVYAKPEENERMVYATRRSVGRAENYAAMSAGFVPSFVVKISHYSEYRDEKRLRIDDKIYKVIRTYETDDDGVELTVERQDD